MLKYYSRHIDIYGKIRSYFYVLCLWGRITSDDQTSPSSETKPAADYDSGERLSVVDIKTHTRDLVSRTFYEQNKDRLKITSDTWDD